MATCLLPNGVGGIGLRRRSTIPKLQRLSFPSKNLVGSRQKPGVVRAGLGELVHGLFVGVGVGLPCTVMECGDIIYRSTLPRSNGLTITAPGVLLGMAAVSYLWSTPGVAPGFFDMFVLAFVERLFRPTYRKDDLVLGKKLGEGAFGVVYKVSSSKKPSGKVFRVKLRLSITE